jgi:hypothetical protein
MLSKLVFQQPDNRYSTQKLNTVIRENSILSANSAFFFNDADAGGGLA